MKIIYKYNYSEYTGFFIASVVSLNPQKDHNVCIPSCFIMKETRLPIHYTKNINGTASLVDAIGKIQEKHMYNTPGLYRIQFATCLCKEVGRNKRKKLMINHRLKQDCKAMKPPKKKIFLEEKQVRDMKNKQEIQNKAVPKVI